jgi:hydrogenase maturation factor HypF (carbamoyltransferase family)
MTQLKMKITEGWNSIPENILLCPFCRKKEFRFFHVEEPGSTTFYSAVISCKGCGVKMSAQDDNGLADEERCIEKWNRRI